MPALQRGRPERDEEAKAPVASPLLRADSSLSTSLAAGLQVQGPRPDTLLQLQRLVGNQATVPLLRRPSVGSAEPATIQRRGKKGKGRGKKGKGRRGGGKNTQSPGTTVAPVTAPQPTATQPTSLLGSVWNYLSGAPSVGTDNEGDTMLAGEEVEGELSGETATEEAPSFFKIPKVVIDLGSKEVEGALGKLKASGKAAGGLEGFQAKGKLEYEYGSGEAKSITDVVYKVLGSDLSAKGTMSSFMGTKAKMELEAQLTSKEWAGKGKLGAFSGMEQKVETEVVLTSGGTELAKFKGAMGWTMGVGGELAASFSWPSGGSWKVATKGKFAVGVGGSWEYELELPVSAFATTLWSWVKSWGTSWATWIYDGLTAG